MAVLWSLARFLALIWCTVLGLSNGFRHSNGEAFSLQMHHKFSEEVKTWMTEKHGMDRDDWPMKGSEEFYRTLYHHDNARHGRNLMQTLTFSEGNDTIRLSRLGFLYYSLVLVGTPNVSLLVALDTGSDLFWVPCDCVACAPTPGANYGLDFDLQTYSPSASKTSKTVSCDSSLCDLQQTCSKSSDQCPYKISYVSENTSSSGTLVEDVLYLIPGNGMTMENEKVVQAPITFGCGKTQTGSFLEGAAPDGLLGLGIEPITVPTVLSNKGFIQNSFSMCFPSNGSIGRFTLGDKGSSDQNQTSFIIDPKHPTYYVGVQEFYVGEKLVQTTFEALFDTGTSFTYLADPAYKDLTSNFHLQTQDTPMTVQDSPFEYCYEVGGNQSISSTRVISLVFNGGKSFRITQPLIFFRDPNTRKLIGYCLAVIQSSSITIIGQNFMSGYQLVFDRDQLKLGWKESNCYDVTYSSSPESSPMTPGQSPLAPSPVNVSPRVSEISNSTQSSRRPSISPALPADPNANDAVHLRNSFLHSAFSFLVFASSLTLM